MTEPGFEAIFDSMCIDGITDRNTGRMLRLLGDNSSEDRTKPTLKLMKDFLVGVVVPLKVKINAVNPQQEDVDFKTSYEKGIAKVIFG